MHVIHIVGSIAREAAGPSYTVRRLAETLAERGADAEIFSTGSPGETWSGKARSRVFAMDHAGVPILSSFSASRAMYAALDIAARHGAIMHDHGLWLMPNLYPAWAAQRRQSPLIVSPRGMLGPAALRFSRRKKLLFWALVQKRALTGAACIHATSDQEAQEIREMGLRAPIAVIPNGIDLPPTEDVNMGRAAAPQGLRTVLHLGRIHPKKGIDGLIAAWGLLERAHPDWCLRIVGPSENGYTQALQHQAASLGLRRVSFEPAIFGAARDAAYRQADLFVLPTLNENFGMVVAEALVNGAPVICTQGAPWQGLNTHGCGWWIDQGVEPLAAALVNAMAAPRATLNAMGAKGRQWMARDFSWARVAAEMEGVYWWCKGVGDQPSSVSTAF